MLAQIAGAESVWAQWGPPGILCGLLLGAIGWIGKRIFDSKERQEAALMAFIDKQQAAATNAATIQAQTAAVLATLATNMQSLDRRVGEVEDGLKGGVTASMAAHEKTHEMLAEIRGRPRSGKAHASTLFLTAAAAGAGMLTAHEPKERVQQERPLRASFAEALRRLEINHPERIL